MFIYLAGLLKKDNRQKIFFDYLEKNNLYLYRKCLEARFDFTNQINETWSKKYTQHYFEQVRSSYLEIIESHFKFIKEYFYPWYSINEKKINFPLKLIIEGSMDFSTPAIDFRFLLAPKTNKKVTEVILREYVGGPRMYTKDKQGNDVSIPINTMRGANHWFVNLQAADMGIDSAREIALYAIKEQLAEIMDKKRLFDIEPPEMTVMQIEKTLRSLPLERFSMIGERKNRKPSLYKHSIDQIVDLFLKRNILQYASSLYYSSEEVVYTVISAVRLQEEKTDPKKYLLPPPDIDWEKLNKSHGYIWDVWSDRQLEKRISRFYEHFQHSYRYLVENYFPSLKEYLPFYAMGPLKFNINYYRDDDFGGGVEVTWEPAANISESKPYIIQIPKRNERNDFQEQSDYKITNEALSRLGRKSLPFFSSSNSSLDTYIGDDDELRKKVYKRLKDDLSFVLGKLK